MVSKIAILLSQKNIIIAIIQIAEISEFKALIPSDKFKALVYLSYIWFFLAFYLAFIELNKRLIMKNKIALITKSYDQNGRCIIDCQK